MLSVNTKPCLCMCKKHRPCSQTNDYVWSASFHCVEQQFSTSGLQQFWAALEFEDFLKTKCLTQSWEFHYPLGNLVFHCSVEQFFLQLFLPIEVLITHKEIFGIVRHTSLSSLINYASFSMRRMFWFQKTQFKIGFSYSCYLTVIISVRCLSVER